MRVTIRLVTSQPQWTVPPAPRPHWPSTLLIVGVIGNTILSGAALILALTQSGGVPQSAYTAAQKSEAQTQFCSRYYLAANAARIDTTGPDPALARISTTNGALMLETAADSPALDSNFRDAALELAAAYRAMTVNGTQGMADDSQRQAILDDAVAKNDVLKEMCGGS